METPHGHGKKGIKRFLYTTALVAVLLSGKSYKEGGWKQLGEDRKKRYEMTIGKGVSWITSLFQHEPGKFFDKKISPDGQYSIYTYILKYGGTSGAVKKQAHNQGIGKAVKIIDENGKDITKSQKKLESGERVTVYVINSEVENETIEDMKCKGGEYFGIDVSRYNTQMDLTSFEERNRNKWDSPEKDKRGVSFIYIRAGDGHPKAKPSADEKSVNDWTTFIKEYNSNETVRNEHEQIATGFYWTLTNQIDATTQAENFLKIYNEYKNIPGGHKLVPMLDLETDRFNEPGKRYKNKKGKIVTTKYIPKEFIENALKRLKYIEEKTGTIPGIYIGAAKYGEYIMKDKRFDKYPIRITAYSSSNPTTGRETGPSPRINFQDGSVKVGPFGETTEITPNMVQSSQQGQIPGTSAKVISGEGKDKRTYNDTDINHTRNIAQLFAKNNKSNNNK